MESSWSTTEALQKHMQNVQDVFSKSVLTSTLLFHQNFLLLHAQPSFWPPFFSVQTYFSNHGYVKTIRFFLLKLQILNFGKSCVYRLVRFRQKTTWLMFGKDHVLALNICFVTPQTVLRSPWKYPVVWHLQMLKLAAQRLFRLGLDQLFSCLKFLTDIIT